MKEQVDAPRSSPVQLAEQILSTSSESTTHFQRLVAWAQENNMEIEFVTHSVCAYQDAYLEAIKNNRSGVTLDEVTMKLIESYKKTPATGWERDQQLRSIEAGIMQNMIDRWDSSIILYCILSDLKSES